jgi:hypothetical protein
MQRNASLLGSEWASAAAGNLSSLLGDGWSTPESWGVWGIDEVHQFFVFLAAPPTQDIELEFDVTGKLYTEGDYRKVSILAGSQKLQDWLFTAADNRSIRNVRIPQSSIPSHINDLPVVQLAFRPTTVVSLSELQSRGGDQRRLGIALHAVRRSA